MAEQTPNASRHPFITSDLRPSDASELDTSPPLAAGDAQDDMQRRAATALAGMPLDLPGNRPEVAGDRLVLTKNPAVHWTVLEDEAVLLNLDNGVYYTLNRVGTVLWECFTGHQSFDRILDDMCERFEVANEQARADLEALVTRLHQEGLITIRKE